jgi:hypothetical protein
MTPATAGVHRQVLVANGTGPGVGAGAGSQSWLIMRVRRDTTFFVAADDFFQHWLQT